MTQREIYTQGMMPHSRAVLSSRSRVFGVDSKEGGEPQLIGTISSFGISSSRTIEPIRGIGIGDHIVEMVPGQSDPVELSVTKFALSMVNIFQEFGYQGGVDGLVRALKHHRYPVDIKHELLVSNRANDGNGLPIAAQPTNVSGSAEEGYVGADDLSDFGVIVTWFEGCWFSSYSVTYPVDSAAITEDATITVTDVTGDSQGIIVLPGWPAENLNSKIWLGTNSNAPN